MRKISRDAPAEKIIEAINDLIASNNAFRDMLENLSISYRFADIEQKIVMLEKKLIAQGDLIISLIDRLNKFDKQIE